MKKVWSLCVLLIALFVVCSLPVLADETDGTVEFILGNTSGKPGDTVKIPLRISVSGDVNYNSIGLALEYDGQHYEDEVLQFMGFEDTEEALSKCYPLGDGQYLGSFDNATQAIVLGFEETSPLNGAVENTLVCNLVFKIKDEAPAGTTTVDMYDVVKMNSEVKDSKVTPATVTIGGETEITVTAVGSKDNVPVYSVEDRTITVTYDIPCKVGYVVDDGNYKKLSATKVNDTTYTYEVPDNVTEIVVVVQGDINGSGTITNADITKLKAIYAGKASLSDAIMGFRCDVNDKSGITNADITKLKAVYAGKANLNW